MRSPCAVFSRSECIEIFRLWVELQSGLIEGKCHYWEERKIDQYRGLFFFRLVIKQLIILGYRVQTCHSYWFYTNFFPLKLGKIQIFSGMPKAFSHTVLIHIDFFPKILIFLVIYTDFVSDHRGRSESARTNNLNSMAIPHTDQLSLT